MAQLPYSCCCFFFVCLKKLALKIFHIFFPWTSQTMQIQVGKVNMYPSKWQQKKLSRILTGTPPGPSSPFDRPCKTFRDDFSICIHFLVGFCFRKEGGNCFIPCTKTRIGNKGKKLEQKKMTHLAFPRVSLGRKGRVQLATASILFCTWLSRYRS